MACRVQLRPLGVKKGLTVAWFKVDDGFWAHPKTLALSPSAVALWVRAGAWSCQQLTDGFVPDHALAMFGPLMGQEHADLVAVGYWDRDDERGGYVFHDWGDYQEPSEKVKQRRAAARERMRTVRANKTRTSGERAEEPDEKFAGSSLNPDPTRPDPTRPTTPNGVVGDAHALSPFCKKHQPNGPEGKPCRACGDARRAYEAAEKAERNKPTQTPPKLGQIPEHRHVWVADGTCTYPGCIQRKDAA